MKRRSHLLLIPLFGVLAACADSMSANERAASCSTDAECGAGQTCFEDGCASPLDLAVVVDPNDSALVTQDFGDVDFTRGHIELLVKPPAIIEGQVKQSVASGSPVDYTGEVVITAKGKSTLVPGLEFPAIKKRIDSGGKFSLSVPGGNWDLTAVTPRDQTLPPAFAQKALSAGSATDPSLTLESGDKRFYFQGHVVKSDANRTWTGATPPSFRFQAVDPTRGRPLSQLYEVLGIAKPPPDNFEYDVHYDIFALYTESLILRVSPAGDAVIPSKDFKIDPKNLPEWLELGEFGDPIDVFGFVQDDKGNPVKGAKVRFEGGVRGGGTWSVEVVTDAKDKPGFYSTRLLANDTGKQYFVTVRPPADSPYTTSVSYREVPANTIVGAPVGFSPLVVGNKVTVTGAVQDSQGQPVRGAVVQIEGNPAGVSPGVSKVDATTDTDGRYSLLVEPGSYRVVVKPVFDLKVPLPWASRRLEVGGETVVPVVRLSEARVVDGAIVVKGAGNTSGLPNANVSLFRSVAATSPDTATAAPIKLFEAVSDATGQFKVILPRAPDRDPNE